MALKAWNDDSGASHLEPTVTATPVPDSFAGQSMAGGAATTEKQGLLMEAAPGSASEGTQLVVDAADHSQGGMTQVATALGSTPGDSDHCVDTKTNGSE